MANEEEKSSGIEIPEFEFDDLTVIETETETDDKTLNNKDETKSEVSKSDEVNETTEVIEKPNESTNEYPEDADETAIGIYNALNEKGWWIEGDEKFKGSVEEVNEFFESFPQRVLGGLMNSMPKSLKNVIQYGYNKGDQLTNEDLVNFFKETNTVELDKIDISDVAGQKAYLIVKEIEAGKEREDAEDLVDLWEDKGKLEERAKKVYEQEKAEKEKLANDKIQQAVIEKADRQANHEKFVKSLRKTVSETKWNKKVQIEVLNEIFQGNLNKKSKIISKYPKALIQLTNYLRYLDEEKGEINEDAYRKQAFSESAKSVKSGIEKNFSNITKAAAIINKQDNSNKKEEFEFAD